MRFIALLVCGQVAWQLCGAVSRADDLTLLTQRHTNTVRLEQGPNDANIAKLTARILQTQHYLKETLPFNDDVSSRFLDRYLEALDNSRIYFLQSDALEFETYRLRLDELTQEEGDTTPGRVIFLRFLERVEQQYEYVAGLLKSEKFEFNGDERYVFNRKKLPRPASLEEAKKLWRDRLRYEYLQEKLNVGRPEVIGDLILNKLNQGKPGEVVEAIQEKLSKEKAQQIGKSIEEKWGREKPEEIVKSVLAALEKDNAEEIVKIITRRYTRVLRALREYDNDDVLQVYLSALTHVYDPHSDYLGKSELENFAIGMKLSLFGIGALLRSTEDGYCKIERLMPGPASKSKKIRANDRIIAVAQGDQEPVDVVEMPLRKVVELIRGPKGTEVRLTLIPADAVDPSVRETVSLLRDEIKLEDQAAKAKIIEWPLSKSQTTRLGLIDLPSFYANFELEGRRSPDERNGPSSFALGDFADYLGSFASKLTKHAGPVSEFLWEQCSPETRQLLSDFMKHVPNGEALEAALVRDLNQVLQGPPLHEEKRFAGVKLSFESQQLLKQKLNAEDLPRLNRRLLQDAYPLELGKPPKSTTVDVARLLKKLTQEKVSGVILDLRRNGGGSLEEAIRLTGLFIKQGPVVQVKGPEGDPIVDEDPDPSVLYEGPLLVLTGRFSASASEILAGALQDYGRGLIVGESSTHGKGTVQSLMQLAPILRQNRAATTGDPGAVKITIRKFYRASGASTQKRGVIPDLVLPSVTDEWEVGEAFLDNALEYDTIPSAKYEKLNLVQPHLAEIKKRSEARLAQDRDFVFVREEIERYRKTAADKSVSLNEAQRLKEKKEADERAKGRNKELASRPEPAYKLFDISLRQVDLPGLPPPTVETNYVKIVAATNAPKPGLTLAPAELKADTKANHPPVAQSKTAAPGSRADDEDGPDADSDENVRAVDPALDEAKRILLDLVLLSSRKPSLAGALSEKAD